VPKLFHDLPSKYVSLKRDRGHEWVKHFLTSPGRRCRQPRFPSYRPIEIHRNASAAGTPLVANDGVAAAYSDGTQRYGDPWAKKLLVF